MPELPELQTIVNELRPHLPGHRVARTWIRHRTLYRRGSLRLPWLIGRTFTDVVRVGKNAVFHFAPSGIMVVNLGMTGRLIYGTKNSWPEANPKHLHGRLHLSAGNELRYYDARRFGHIFLAEECDFRRDLNIGEDPFSANRRYFKKWLVGRRAPIKSLLLDQRILSGIGNIYADETLFYAGVDPRVSGDRAAKLAGHILKTARVVLKRAIAHGGSTLKDYRKPDGSSGGFQQYHAVYGREGDRCVQCRTAVKKITLGGRGTHFCPGCQR